MIVSRLKRLFVGGSAGNEQLTLAIAALLIVLLAVEGATILQIGSLLTIHAFVGMLLIPVVALKIASTGWRMLRYHQRGEEYVLRGPPHIALRMVIAPLLVLSTLLVFGTGVALLALDQRHGTLVGLHKASFLVWVGAFGLHVLVHLFELPRLRWVRIPGAFLRVALVTASVAAGLVLAIERLPAADRLQDHAAAHVGFDDR
jgi:hypothetical protein